MTSPLNAFYSASICSSPTCIFPLSTKTVNESTIEVKFPSENPSFRSYKYLCCLIEIEVRAASTTSLHALILNFSSKLAFEQTSKYV